MAKVKFKVRTRWAGKLRDPGEEIDVKKEIAERWVKNGIAEAVKGKKAEVVDQEEGSQEEEPEGGE